MRALVAWLIVGFILALIVLAPLPVMQKPGERVVRIEARSFEFNPGIVSVRPGDRVTIELVSTDVVHGIVIDGLGLHLSAEPGQTQRLSFVASRVGTFRIRCSETCGPLHPFMIGKLQVGTSTLFIRAVSSAILLALAVLFIPGINVRPAVLVRN